MVYRNVVISTSDISDTNSSWGKLKGNTTKGDYLLINVADETDDSGAVTTPGYVEFYKYMGFVGTTYYYLTRLILKDGDILVGTDGAVKKVTITSDVTVS